MNAPRPLDGSRRAGHRIEPRHRPRDGPSPCPRRRIGGRHRQVRDRAPRSSRAASTPSRRRSRPRRLALAVRVDVRHEDEVKAMVDATVDRFGRLDILVNNAGALWWQPVLETPPKRYDLMWEINVRAAYLCSYYALPHMVAQRWGHIIICSPPISTQPSPGTCRLHDDEDGHDPSGDRDRRRARVRWDRLQLALAGDDHREPREHQLGPRRSQPVALAGDPLRRHDGDRRHRATQRSPAGRSSTSRSCASGAGPTSDSTPTGSRASPRSIRSTSTDGPAPRCRPGVAIAVHPYDRGMSPATRRRSSAGP